jgi:hypothetical protein
MSCASRLAEAHADRGRLAGGYAIARRIAALDPVRDNEEATHLSIEVRYGDAIFVHAAYTVAFARQVAVPSIARIVYRSGTGDMMRDVRRRNDDTLVFFGEMLRHGHSSARARAVIDRMEQIHARFGISDADKLYTLASLALEADRIVEHLGLRVFTPAEKLARFHFWRGVGEYMGLTVPPSPDRLLAWTRDYERAHYATTEGGRALVDQLFADWRERWFPGPLRRHGDAVLLLLFDEELRAVHRLLGPPARLVRAAPAVVRAYLALQGARPHRLDRSWADHFIGDRALPPRRSSAEAALPGL